MIPENLSCKEVFRRAYENRYVWPIDFKGYEGDFEFEDSQISSKGSFVLGKDFTPKIIGISDQKIIKNVSSQLFEVSIHRVKREFDNVHSQNKFELINSSDNGLEMIVKGKNDGDKYRVNNDCINMVYRHMHGVIIEIFVEEFFDTSIGMLSKKYTSQQIDPKTKSPISNKIKYVDEFENVLDSFWILKSRMISLEKDNSTQLQRYSFKGIKLL